jgi:hypothetical protein
MVLTNQYTVGNSWNMVSLPLRVDDPRRVLVFPTATSNAFAYVSGTGYVQRDTLVNGLGYWLKFGIAQNIGITGAPQSQDTVHVNTGWNIIGSITDPIDTASIGQIPPGIIQSAYYGYDGGYSASDSIRPAHAYWVKANASGKLVLSTGSAGIFLLPSKARDVDVRWKSMHKDGARDN